MVRARAIPIVLIPLLLMGAPFLVFFANDWAGVILGPPAIWNRTRNLPPKEDLIGRYTESRRDWSRKSFHRPASVTLNMDGTVHAEDLPWEFGEDACILTGSGKWELTGEGIEIRYDAVRQANGVCKSMAFPSFVLAGHSKPYSLYMTLGDPDSGTGVWFKREK